MAHHLILRMNCAIIVVRCGTKHDLPFWSSRGLYFVRLIILCMDASGDQSDEQQAAETRKDLFGMSETDEYAII